MPLYADDACSVQYADDTQVLVSGRHGDIGALTGSMERDLSRLSNWFGKNGMKINAQKTQLIALGTRQNLRHLPPVSIKFMGATVSGSPTVRNLGVIFDQCMTFAAHVDDVARRCSGILIGWSHSRHRPHFHGHLKPSVRRSVVCSRSCLVSMGTLKPPYSRSVVRSRLRCPSKHL